MRWQSCRLAVGKTIEILKLSTKGQLRAGETRDTDSGRQLDSFASRRDIGRMGLILKQTQ
jgi:hypothetical protein